MAAVLAAAGADAGDVAAGVGLGEAVGAPLEGRAVQVLEHPEEALLLLGGAGAAHGRAAEAGAGETQEETGVAPGELLGGEDAEEIAAAGAASLLGVLLLLLGLVAQAGAHRVGAHARGEARHVAEELLGDAAGAVPREGLRADHVLREAADPLAHLELLLAERKFDGHDFFSFFGQRDQTKAFWVSGVGRTSPGSTGAPSAMAPAS